MEEKVLKKAASFLRDYKDYIREKKFLDLFARAAWDGVSNIGAVGYMLHSAGIPFYSYMNFVPNNAFFESDIESIHLPDGVEHIGQSAFAGCKLLRHLSSSCDYINTMCFANSGLSDIPDIPNVELYPTGAFYGCLNMKFITIPNGVDFIGESCFENCSNLMEVTLPKSIQQIHSYAFAGCNVYMRIHYPGTSYEWKEHVIRFPDWNRGTDRIIVHCSDGDIMEVYED